MSKLKDTYQRWLNARQVSIKEQFTSIDTCRLDLDPHNPNLPALYCIVLHDGDENQIVETISQMVSADGLIPIQIFVMKRHPR